MIEKELSDRVEALLDRPTDEFSAMAGATSSDLYLVTSGSDHWVLRVFKTERWVENPAQLSIREVRILEALTATDLPTPTPVAILPGNGVLMSYLPGSVVLPRAPGRKWIEELAVTLAGIHRTDSELPYRFESWNDTRNQPPPAWWPDHSLWHRAQQVSEQPPDYAPVLVHRDYHPVNVLWSGGTISGVVDWINACKGPAGVDVAHCRLNLAIMYDLAAAGLFLDAYTQQQPGYVHEPYWDVDDALGALPEVEPYPPWQQFGMDPLTKEQVQRRLIEFLRAAVDRLGYGDQ